MVPGPLPSHTSRPPRDSGSVVGGSAPATAAMQKAGRPAEQDRKTTQPLFKGSSVKMRPHGLPHAATDGKKLTRLAVVSADSVPIASSCSCHWTCG